MNAMLAIFKREARSYFGSPIAWVIITIFLVLTGIFFYMGMSQYAQVSFQVLQRRGMDQSFNATELVLRSILQIMATIFMFVLPLLTMRLFSEEKKNGTIELILTYPLKDYHVVLGKYLASALVVFLMLALTYTVPGLISYLSSSVNWSKGTFSGLFEMTQSFFLLTGAQDPEPGVVFAGYLGLFLFAASILALGMFCSSLTENQIVSAVLTFGAVLLFWIIGFLKYVSSGAMADFFENLSLLNHYENFAKGIIDTKDVVFYLSFIFFFTFATLRSVESYRWKG